MTLPLPLTVRLHNADTDRHVTRDLRNLEFRSVVPGGFASAQAELDRPLAQDQPELAPYTNVTVYDARTGRIVWNGWLEDPGRGAGRDGQVWELAAIGPSSHATDRTTPYVLADLDGDGWERVTLNPNERVDGEHRIGSTTAGGDTELTLRVPEGTTVDASVSQQVWTLRYRRLVDADMKLARVELIWDAGFTNSDWHAQLVTRTGFTGSGTVAASQAIDAAGGTLTAVVVTDFTNGEDVLEFRLQRGAGNSTIGDGNVWLTGTPQDGAAVWALRVDKTGTEITSASQYQAGPKANDIVEDVLGRILDLYDGENATVDDADDTAGTAQFDQLAYPDGTTAAQVLEDLMARHPEMYWAAWERVEAGVAGPSGDTYTFEWRRWPQTIRYEADVTDGYRSTGSAAGLFNRARVRFRGPNKAIKTIQRTQTVPELDDIGRVREMFIDLGDEISTQVVAENLGDAQLAQHKTPPNAGTLTIARPIMDRDRGHPVMPWEIRPGHLIRVRGIRPHIDALNKTDRDGTTTFRIVAVEFSTRDATATLELDSLAPSIARDLAATRSHIRPIARGSLPQLSNPRRR